MLNLGVQFGVGVYGSADLRFPSKEVRAWLRPHALKPKP